MRKLLPEKTISVFFLLVYAVLIVFGINILKEFRVNTRNDALYQNDDSDYKNLLYLRNTYHTGNTIVAALSGEGIFTSSGLKYIEELSDKIKTRPGVVRVISLATLDDPTLFDGTGSEDFHHLIQNSSGGYNRFRDNILKDGIFTGWLISKDARTTGIIIDIRAGYRDRDIRELVKFIRTASTGGDFDLHIAGYPANAVSFSEYIIRDQRIFAPVIIILFSLILLIIYRSFRGMAYPLLVISLSEMITMLIFLRTGHELTPVSSLLIPVILTIAVTDSIHILNRYLLLKRETIKTVLRECLLPCFMTSMTTAFGFGSLIIFRTPAIVEFGTFAALGCLIAFFVTYTLLFSLITLFGFSGKYPVTDTGRQWPRRLYVFIARYKYRIILTGVILLPVSGFFINTIKVNTDYISYLKKKDRLYESNIFIDRNLTGINSVDILVRSSKREMLNDPEIFRALLKLEKFLRTEDSITCIISPADFYERILKAQSINPEFSTENDMLTARGIAQMIAGSSFSRYYKGEHELRMHVRFRSMPSKETSEMIKRIKKFCKTILPDDVTAYPIGEIVLFSHTAETLVRTQTKSFALAMGIILLMFALCFRSVWIMIVAVLPNILPIAAAYAFMGIFNIDLSLPTSQVAAASFGLIVDDTIHFLHEFSQGRKKGLDTSASIEYSFSRVVRAAFMTSLVLCVGIGTGMLSNFKPTYYFSVLLCISVVTAFICDILVTPAMLLAGDAWGVIHRRTI